MKKFINLLFVSTLLLITSTINAQHFISATEIASLSASSVEGYLNTQGWDTSPMTINGVTSYNITYNTVDVNGAPTVASGALYVPQLCDTLPWVSYHHGTEYNKSHVPSNNFYRGQGLLYSGNGYITTLPDYLGMGINQGIHPYIHWESEATASIDLIRAAREFLADSLQIWNNNQLFLAGYSQGGHSTMAVHKYITANNLQNEFNVIASAPMSGPYALSSDQFDFVFDGDSIYPKPAYLAYIFTSYQLVYENLYTNYDEYYDPPYDSIIDAWIAAGTDPPYLPTNYYYFIQDSVLNNIQNIPNHPFNVDLRDNDLHNWIPQEPVRMLFCSMDPLVAPQNSITAQDTMNALGATDVQAIDVFPSGNHYSCFIPATTYSLQWFDSLKVQCSMVGISIPSIKKQPDISLYPNPVKDIATFSSEEITSIEIYNMMGALIVRRIDYKVDMTGMKSGMYFVIGLDKHSEPLYKGRVVKY